VESICAQVTYNTKLGCDGWPLPLTPLLRANFTRLIAAEIRFLRSTEETIATGMRTTMMMLMRRMKRWRSRKR
jgi:hypothetical protein